MKMITKYRLPLIILLIAAIAGGAGLYLAGMIGGKDAPVQKERLEPIKLGEEPFILNLADTERTAYVKLGLYVELEPMTPEDKLLFEAAPESGGHGGGGADAITGPKRVSADPTLHDAVIDVTSRFTSDELLTPAGKEDLKEALLERFDKVARDQAPAKPKTAGKHGKAAAAKHEEPVHRNPAHAPFHISDVYFTSYAVQR